MIIYKYLPDSFVISPNKVSKLRHNILYNNHVWNYVSNIKTKRNLNIVDYEYHNNTFIKIYEVPILDNFDKELLEWILTFQINDIIRILEANEIKFSKNGTIINSYDPN